MNKVYPSFQTDNSMLFSVSLIAGSTLSVIKVVSLNFPRFSFLWANKYLFKLATKSDTLYL